MARIFKANEPVSAYRDRRFKGSQDDFMAALHSSCTVYVGNLSFYTTEEQIYEVFSRCGEVKRIIMGLDKTSMTPCGFCFVQYYTREDTEDAVKYVSGTILDDRPVRVDFDWGFEDGRQWGRGRSGGQVRDEYRTDYDPGRGGYGKMVQRELELRHYGEFGSPEAAAPLAGRLGPQFQQQSGPYRAKRRERFNGGGGGGGGGANRGKESGKKRNREEVQQETTAGVKFSEDNGPKVERNPRFRERGDNSDEEDDRK